MKPQAYTTILTHRTRSIPLSAGLETILAWIESEDAEAWTGRRVVPSALVADVSGVERFLKAEWTREG